MRAWCEPALRTVVGELRQTMGSSRRDKAVWAAVTSVAGVSALGALAGQQRIARTGQTAMLWGVSVLVLSELQRLTELARRHEEIARRTLVAVESARMEAAERAASAVTR